MYCRGWLVGVGCEEVFVAGKKGEETDVGLCSGSRKMSTWIRDESIRGQS